jgi:hypothetical protein
MTKLSKQPLTQLDFLRWMPREEQMCEHARGILSIDHLFHGNNMDHAWRFDFAGRPVAIGGIFETDDGCDLGWAVVSRFASRSGLLTLLRHVRDDMLPAHKKGVAVTLAPNFETAVRTLEYLGFSPTGEIAATGIEAGYEIWEVYPS